MMSRHPRPRSQSRSPVRRRSRWRNGTPVGSRMRQRRAPPTFTDSWVNRQWTMRVIFADPECVMTLPGPQRDLSRFL